MSDLKRRPKSDPTFEYIQERDGSIRKRTAKEKKKVDTVLISGGVNSRLRTFCNEAYRVVGLTRKQLEQPVKVTITVEKIDVDSLPVRSEKKPKTKKPGRKKAV